MEEKSKIEFKAAIFAEDFHLAELIAQEELHNANQNSFYWQNSLGLLKILEGDFNAALQCFERASVNDSTQIESLLNTAVTLADLGYYAQAQKKFSEAAGLPLNFKP
ncbi:MAG: hypothetical protein K2X39_10560 [Silvanigrellaceae bacterium]|nr:hypothetical protein [Silvanigrellaceae bacterium]